MIVGNAISKPLARARLLTGSQSALDTQEYLYGKFGSGTSSGNLRERLSFFIFAGPRLGNLTDAFLLFNFVALLLREYPGTWWVKP